MNCQRIRRVLIHQLTRPRKWKNELKNFHQHEEANAEKKEISFVVTCADLTFR